jgi:hypothetical protein
VTIRVSLVAALACVAFGCRVPIARFSAIGEPPSAAGTARAGPPQGERTTGYSCRWWILGVTLGVPHIEEAVADAVERSGAAGLLLDADLVSVHPAYGPLGKHCYEITATPWRPPREADASP